MLKRHDKLFSHAQKLVDVVTLSASWVLAYLFRFHILKDADDSNLLTFAKVLPVIVLITIYFFRRNGLYRSYRFSSRHKEIGAIIKANTQSILLLVILLYFLAPARLSRLTLFSYIFISNFLLIAVRLSVRNFLRLLRRSGKNLRHVLLVGNSSQLAKYIHKLRSHKDAGMNIIGWIDSKGLAEKCNIKELNDDVEEAVVKYRPDSVVVGYSGNKSHKIEKILLASHSHLTPIQVLPDLTFSLIGHQVEDFAGLPLLTVNHPRLSTIDHLLKRAFDIVFSLFGLIVVSPFLFLIGLLVKISSRGPILYGQKRMGLDGENFTMWKFRTMKVDKEAESKPGWTVENDPRRTKLGTFLRSSSLDELPQLWNVFVGDMSLVGPRPEQPFYVSKFREKIPAYMLRHKVKAGITGWAQVNGWRGDTSISKRVECDIYYIKNWSLWLDIKIMFLTFWKGFFSKNAY